MFEALCDENEESAHLLPGGFGFSVVELVNRSVDLENLASMPSPEVFEVEDNYKGNSFT